MFYLGGDSVNRSILRAFSVFAVTLMLSCSVKPSIHVFNNSTQRIIVEAGQNKFIAEPGEEVSFVWGNEELTIVIGTTRVRYSISTVPPGYVRTGWLRAHVTFQLEADGKVFILRSHDRPPVIAASYRQPPGYPLAPIAHIVR